MLKGIHIIVAFVFEQTSIVDECVFIDVAVVFPKTLNCSTEYFIVTTVLSRIQLTFIEMFRTSEVRCEVQKFIMNSQTTL